MAYQTRYYLVDTISPLNPARGAREVWYCHSGHSFDHLDAITSCLITLIEVKRKLEVRPKRIFLPGFSQRDGLAIPKIIELCTVPRCVAFCLARFCPYHGRLGIIWLSGIQGRRSLAATASTPVG
jgi:hypothetical protein